VLEGQVGKHHSIFVFSMSSEWRTNKAYSQIHKKKKKEKRRKIECYLWALSLLQTLKTRLEIRQRNSTFMESDRGIQHFRF